MLENILQNPTRTMLILIRSLPFFLCFACILYFSLPMDLYILCSILAVDFVIILYALFVGLLRVFSTYIIGLIF
jgi:hypothetical protein